MSCQVYQNGAALYKGRPLGSPQTTELGLRETGPDVSSILTDSTGFTLYELRAARSTHKVKCSQLEIQQSHTTCTSLKTSCICNGILKAQSVLFLVYMPSLKPSSDVSCLKKHSMTSPGRVHRPFSCPSSVCVHALLHFYYGVIIYWLFYLPHQKTTCQRRFSVVVLPTFSSS